MITNAYVIRFLVVGRARPKLGLFRVLTRMFFVPFIHRLRPQIFTTGKAPKDKIRLSSSGTLSTLKLLYSAPNRVLASID